MAAADRGGGAEDVGHRDQRDRGVERRQQDRPASCSRGRHLYLSSGAIALPLPCGCRGDHGYIIHRQPVQLTCLYPLSFVMPTQISTHRHRSPQPPTSASWWTADPPAALRAEPLPAEPGLGPGTAGPLRSTERLRPGRRRAGPPRRWRRRRRPRAEPGRRSPDPDDRRRALVQPEPTPAG